MRPRDTALALIVLACFCSEPEKAPPAKGTLSAMMNAPPVDDRLERSNLLNIAGGASVISRTGEMTLQFSAVNLIDGDPSTPWISPPEDPQQSIVIALLARATVEKLGIQTTSIKTQVARTVRIDLSLDGREFEPAATMTATPSDDVQWATTKPRDAAFLRVTTVDANGRFVQLQSILANGRILEEVRPRKIEGCWTINGRKARFQQRGARVSGVIEDRIPMFVEGGTDGSVVHLSWVKGPQFGVAAVSLGPDSRSLSGMKWHEVAVTEFFGEAWFGERAVCGATGVRSDNVFRSLFMKTKAEAAALYGLSFDDKGVLDIAASESTLRLLTPLFSAPIKLVAREFRLATEAENLAVSKAKIDSLRSELEKRKIDLKNVSFEAAGTRTRRVKPLIQITREMYSVVEIEKQAP